jgi:hypothetical protein
MKMLSQMKTIDYEYYDWLVSNIALPPNKSFNTLFDMMHSREFIWLVPNDDNRIQDALELRSEFLKGKNKKLALDGATLLEVLISLSRRASFTAGYTPEHWAWKLIKNLQLHKEFDPLTQVDMDKIDEALETLIWRTYRKDGRGGFFPLKHPEEDQTQVEIWYQMNKYVIESSS